MMMIGRQTYEEKREKRGRRGVGFPRLEMHTTMNRPQNRPQNTIE